MVANLGVGGRLEESFVEAVTEAAFVTVRSTVCREMEGNCRVVRERKVAVWAERREVEGKRRLEVARAG